MPCDRGDPDQSSCHVSQVSSSALKNWTGDVDRDAPQHFPRPLDWSSRARRPPTRLDHPPRAEFGGRRRHPRSPHPHHPIHLLHRRQRWMNPHPRQMRTFGLQMMNSGPPAE